MTKQFVRIETMHGQVHYFNVAFIVSVRPRGHADGFASGATIEVQHGEGINTYHTDPGTTTQVILDFLQIGR